MTKNSRYNTKIYFTEEDMSTLPIVSYPPSFEILSIYSNPSMICNYSSTVNDLSTLISFIKQDLGVGLITRREYNLLKKTEKLILRPIQHINNTNIYFAYVLSDSAKNSPQILDFVKSITSHQSP